MNAKRGPRPLAPGSGHPSRLGVGVRGRGLVEPFGPADPARLVGGEPAAATAAVDGRQGRPRSEGVGLLWVAGAVGERGAADRGTTVAAVCRGTAGLGPDDPLPGLVLRPTGASGEEGAAADLGQC